MKRFFRQEKAPRRFAILLIIAFTSSVAIEMAAAGDLRIVSPAGFESADGNTFGQLTPNLVSLPFREQGLHLSSDFASLPEGGAKLLGLAIRLDRRSTSPLTIEFPGAEIRVSTTTAKSLSETFANNIGTDEMLVFSGDLMQDQPLGKDVPRDFGEVFMFTTPFPYYPQNGNLLIDMTFNGGMSPALSLDAQTTKGVSTIVGFDTSGFPSSGEGSNFIIVRQFIFSPEPPLSVSACGMLGLFAWRRRRQPERGRPHAGDTATSEGRAIGASLSDQKAP